MADLTPELLERLGYLTTVRDGILVKLDEASGGDPDDDPSSTYLEMGLTVSLEFMDSATALVKAARELAEIRRIVNSEGPTLMRFAQIKEVLNGGT